jgi:hypothetical protein
LTGASVNIGLNESKPIDLKGFSIGLASISLIGLFGLISRRKRFAWCAYVTFGILLIGFPIGTVLGIFGIKWMKEIFPGLEPISRTSHRAE